MKNARTQAPVATVSAFGAVALALMAASADAEVGFDETITLDHHLIQADFIGLVDVERVEQMDGGTFETSYYDIRLRVRDAWFSRWVTEDGTPLEYATSPRVEPITAGDSMVVLLSGGDYVDAPYTFGRHSRFVVEEAGTVRCGDGTTLFGVWSDAFMCTVQLHVDGAPSSLAEFREELLHARTRAVARHTRVASDLDAAARSLNRYPVEIGGAP